MYLFEKGMTMSRKKIALEHPERFSGEHKIPREKLGKAAEAACEKLKARIERDGVDFPRNCSFDYKYPLGKNDNWECGMHTGTLLLAYQLTGDEFFKDAAEKELPTYIERYENKVYIDSHDAGFVYIPSCVGAYKLFGREDMKENALNMVNYYYEHCFSHEGGFIIRNNQRARDGEFPSYRTMMDSMMNAPLLFWASEVTGDKKYAEAALRHVKTTADCLIREDSSSFHHYQFDPESHKPLYGVTLQGRADDSTWSRGHSWGIYGFPIAYSYRPEEFIKEVHHDTAYFMLNHLPADNIPYWDYDFVDGDEPRDSSAGVISACGFLEMAAMLQSGDPDKKIFENAAAMLIEAVIDSCTGDIGRDYDGLICHVTHAKPQRQGIDECAVYGDYFYLEALARYLLPGFKKPW